MTNEIALKPCPFCGGTNIQSLKELDFVCCQDCGASLEDSEPSARGHWNTRALPAQGEQVVEAHLQQARDSIETIIEECAQVAESHIGAANDPNYDEACRDIAKAIRLALMKP